MYLTRLVQSNAGGGGERVLWTAVALMQRTEPEVISVVYTGDTDATKEEIIVKVEVRHLTWWCVHRQYTNVHDSE
jgi:hypothetical protein